MSGEACKPTFQRETRQEARRGSALWRRVGWSSVRSRCPLGHAVQRSAISARTSLSASASAKLWRGSRSALMPARARPFGRDECSSSPESRTLTRRHAGHRRDALRRRCRSSCGSERRSLRTRQIAASTPFRHALQALAMIRRVIGGRPARRREHVAICEQRRHGEKPTVSKLVAIGFTPSSAIRPCFGSAVEPVERAGTRIYLRVATERESHIARYAAADRTTIRRDSRCASIDVCRMGFLAEHALENHRMVMRFRTPRLEHAVMTARCRAPGGVWYNSDAVAALLPRWRQVFTLKQPCERLGPPADSSFKVV